MSTLVLAAMLGLLLPAQATVPKEPAKDLFLRSASVPGVELRFVDYHWQPVIVDAMAPVPRGETIYRGPARFEAVSPLQERLSVTLTEEGDKVLVTLVYGNRRLPLTFTR
jgi:hypothetical protein